jgi:hypothetical protein
LTLWVCEWGRDGVRWLPWGRLIELRGDPGEHPVLRNRPALSRWHPDYKDEFAAFLASESPFRR